MAHINIQKINTLCNLCLLRNKKIPIYGNGDQIIIGFLLVIVMLLIRCLKKEKGRNLSVYENEMKNRDLIKNLVKFITN